MHPLNQFRDTSAARLIETIWFAGPHRFEERVPLTTTFPGVKRIYLFEPLPEIAAQLQAEMATDPRVEVFGCALSDFEGSTDFFVSNNLVSSSLLPMGKHAEIFPNVTYARTIRVQARTARGILAADGIKAPNLLLMDAQGAELRILAGMPAAVREKIEIIFTEASLEELYVGSGTLDDLRNLLEGEFDFFGFWPMPGCPCHGDALFVNQRLGSLLQSAS